MQIRLTRTYRGFDTKGAPIPEGEYSTGDKALLGVDPAYLVGIGVAVDITPSAPPKETAPSKPSAKKDKK